MKGGVTYYHFRLSWYLARRCPAMTPDMQTSTNQYVSVITDHLSLCCEVKTAHDTGYTDLDQHIGREQVPSSQLACFAHLHLQV